RRGRDSAPPRGSVHAPPPRAGRRRARRGGARAGPRGARPRDLPAGRERRGRRGRSARRRARALAGRPGGQARDRPGGRREPRRGARARARRDRRRARERGQNRPPRRPPAVRRVDGYHPGVRGLLTIVSVLGACTLLATGCGDSARKASAAPTAAPKPSCAYPAGWQRLANRIHTAVYCPGWLPDPLTSQIGGRWNNINSVSKDRSYLESFVWQETGGGAAGGELHVNLRAYPGVTKIPTCRTGGADSRNVPCFADPGRKMTANGITARI